MGDTIPKCPHCGKEITELHNKQSGTAIYILDRDGNYEENTDDFFIADEVRNDFDCPECHETITTNEEEALQFLNGETA